MGSVIDFTHPAVQEMIIQQAAEIARCGIFDGTGLDHWGKGGIGPITDEKAWEQRIVSYKAFVMLSVMIS